MKLKSLSLLAAAILMSQVANAHHHGDHSEHANHSDHEQHSDHEKHNHDHAHHGSSSEFIGESQSISDAITIEDARAKATIPGVKVGAGYLTIVNESDETLRLTEAKTTVAEHTEIHRMFMRDSKMAMRKVEYVEIEANEKFYLKPGGYHLMFMMLNQRLTDGESIEVELVFDNGTTATIDMPVIKAD
ncbi:copper chaperone PCu(A)C [Vibrio mexicanus]|uniref:copper chaperone PCu(A)C n=1 Tax=Vibrio mexicanus TaxID=1004326 RepID=UPI00063C5632|nr:copper chaperone PCu(A)C [Vibrio mexicanus]